MYRIDSNGNHIDKAGNYGFCSADCKSVDMSEGGEDNESSGGEEGGQDNETIGGKEGGESTALCSAVSGPASGSQCVFPFTLGEQTFTECAEWSFGGDNQGKLWCSTK